MCNLPKIERVTEFNVPLADVWDLLCDINRYPEWEAASDRIITVQDGPVAAGFEYKDHGGVPPFKGLIKWRVEVFEPMRRQVHVGKSGPITFRIDSALTETPTGTRMERQVVVRAVLPMRPVLALLWNLFLRKRALAVIQKTSTGAKHLLESPGK
jgi:carbon monoxide dehydrogenase subunit G